MRGASAIFILLTTVAVVRADVIYEYAGPVVLQPGAANFTPPGYSAVGDAEYARLSFEMREYELDPEGIIPSGFLGWRFKNARGEQFTNYTSVNGVHFLCVSPSGKTIVGDSASGSTAYVRIPYGESGDDSGWSRFEIESGRENFFIKIDGLVNYTDEFSFPPFNGLMFWLYGKRKFEIRNLRLETVPKPIVERVEEPTLSVAGEVSPGTTVVPRAVSSAVGGVMFWAKYVPGTDCVKLLDAAGNLKARFYCYGDYRIQADVAVADSSDMLVYKRRLFDEATRATDDFHYAFTWDEKGLVRFFLNGVPYTLGSNGDTAEFPIVGNDLDGVAQVVVCNDTRQRQSLRDLSVYRRPLTNAEVQAAFRARLPVDLAFHDSILKAGEPDALVLTVAPGGTYTLPAPVDGAAPVTGLVDVAVVAQQIVPVYNADGKRISYNYPEVGRWTWNRVTVTNATDLVLDGLTLPRGSYRALVTVTAPGQEPSLRTKFFKVYPDVAPPVPIPDKSPWRKTKLLWSKQFDSTDDMPYAQGSVTAVDSPLGTYLESGPIGGLFGDRMGTMVSFPAEAKGHPCLLEIDWPDDKDRMIGWCMFLESTTAQHRDRLMAGVCAGDRLKTTGRLQTARYLFYPSSTNHLFEVRTQATGRPGAIAALRVWRLDEPLPVLQVHRPEGYPARRFGHVDEDQTFYFLLNDQHVSGLDGITAALAEYFGYTGQSVFDYTLFRYQVSFAPSDLFQPYTGYAGAEGEIPYVLRQFARIGLQFNANEGLKGEPHIVHSKRIEADYEAMGFISRDADGYSIGSGFAGDAYPNMANPSLQDRYFAYCEDYLKRCAQKGLGVLRVPVTMLGCYEGADYGHEAWSRAKFTADTGIASPADDEAAWYAWRARQVTNFFARFVAWANEKVPRLEVRLVLPAGGDNDYRAKGIDVAELVKIPGCTFGFSRGYTQYWWDIYRSNTTNLAAYAALYDTTKPIHAALRSAGRSVAEATSSAAYFETFRDSLVNDRFNTYFQSLDVKPWGRNYLREPAFMVGALDALSYTVGDQPLGSLGNEDETREFVQAYSALPALPFKDVACTAAGIVCRSLVTANGTYFYLVNLTDTVRNVRLGTPSELPPVIDLSSDATLSTRVFALKEYQLRSFLIPGREVVLPTVEETSETGVGDVVLLLGGDAAGTSATTNAAAWSDGRRPHADAPYLVANGLDAPLRTIEGDVKEVRTDVWTGGQLQIGSSIALPGSLLIMEHGNPSNAGNPWTYVKGYPKFQADDLVLTKGEIGFADGPYARLQGAATIRATADDPFVVRLAKASNFLEANLTGDAAAALRFTKDGTDSVENYRIFVSGDNAAYAGQLIFDGVTLSSGENQVTSFGVSPSLRRDALVFRNGARIRPDFNWTLQPGNLNGTQTLVGENRGITFESGSGIRLYTKSTLDFKLGIFGEMVNVWGDWGSAEGRRDHQARAIFNGPVEVGIFRLGNEGSSSGTYRDLPRLVFGENSSVEGVPTVEGLSGGTIGAQGRTVTVRRALSGETSYFESGFDATESTLGHVILAEGSTLGAGSVVIRVQGFPRWAKTRRLPVLTVPVSVRPALAHSDVVLKTLSFADSDLPCEVVSDGTKHTAFVSFTEGLASQRFVMAPETIDGAVYAPDGAYHSWATATTNLAEAIAVAEAGDTVYVAKGVHPILETIILEKDVTVLGVDPVTMIPDRGAILDGGYPARTNRLMKLKKAKLNFLTFRNAGTTSNGCYIGYGPGGAAINSSYDCDWRVSDCVFSNCVAVGTSGGAISTHGVRGVDSCVRCLFVDCRADESGGGLQSQYDNADESFGFRDCTFIGNRATKNGGAIFTSGRGLRLTNCRFLGNVAHDGGSFFAGRAQVEHCIFDGTGVTTGAHPAFNCENNNGAELRDIVVHNFNLPAQGLVRLCGNAIVDSLVMTNNICARLMHQYVDAVHTHRRITIRNGLFTDNTVGEEAFLVGGYYFDLENCTVVSNRMVSNLRYFRNISSYQDDNTLVNCIFWNNGTSASHENMNTGAYQLTITNSIFDCAVNGPADVNVWTGDPLLDADFVPRRGSPSVDRGVLLGWMTAQATDCRGYRRVRPAGAPDLGAREAIVDTLAFVGGESAFDATTEGRLRATVEEMVANDVARRDLYYRAEKVRFTGPQGLVPILVGLGLAPTFPLALDTLGILNLSYAEPRLEIIAFDAPAGEIRFRVTPGAGNRIISSADAARVSVGGTDDLAVPMQAVSDVNVDLTPYLGAETKGEGLLAVPPDAPAFLRVLVE